ncbi:MAG: ABC transporter ATP-binding protein [Thermomonas sp.]
MRFAYGRHVLYEHFDLQVETPGVYGIFGRNGSGKSTLLKLIAGLLFRKGGDLRVAGFDPGRRHPDFLAGMYIVPEEFHLPNLSCARLAELQAGFYPRFSRTVLDESLSVFGLDAHAGFNAMSLGEKKKAVLAFALATRTPVLLLDEPTNGLDIVGRDQFKALVQAPEQRDRVVLISTHQAHDLERVMQHMVFIDQGRLALSAPMDTLSRTLKVGMAPDAPATASIANLIYSEPVGEQVAYVAARDAGERPAPVHIELLYKALCKDKQRVLDAIERGGNAHV